MRKQKHLECEAVDEQTRQLRTFFRGKDWKQELKIRGERGKSQYHREGEATEYFVMMETPVKYPIILQE